MLLFTLFSLLLCICYEPASAIWPIPSTISVGQEALLLSEDFSFQLDFSGAPQDLLNAIERTQQRLHNDRLARLVVGRGASDANELLNAGKLDALHLSLSSNSDGQIMTIKSISDEITSSIDDRIERESYSLQIPSSGRDALLVANSTLGLLRGLSTFEQLWYTYGKYIYTLNAPLDVTDKPAYVSLILQDQPRVSSHLLTFSVIVCVHN